MKREKMVDRMETGLVHKVARMFIASGIPYEDLFQEACVGYLKAMPQWDSSRGKQTTFLWNAMKRHLINYVSNYYPDPAVNGVEIDDELFSSGFVSPLRYVLFKEVCEAMSDGARETLQIIFTDPCSVLERNPTEARKGLQKKLRSIGWSPYKIRNTLREINSMLASFSYA